LEELGNLKYEIAESLNLTKQKQLKVEWGKTDYN